MKIGTLYCSQAQTAKMMTQVEETTNLRMAQYLICMILPEIPSPRLILECNACAEAESLGNDTLPNEDRNYNYG